jgi:HTH-type transcriptional regulator / antitoxin HigA
MATESAQRWQPNWAVHPGEVLAEALEERAMSQAELARRMDRPLKTINEIVKGKSAITHDTAIQLELVLGITARLWNNLQRDYWEAEARLEERRRLENEAAWVHNFPLGKMVRHGWLSAAKSKSEALSILLRFFAVSSPSAWERQWATTQAAFRRSPAFTPSRHAVSAWLRRGEIKASDIECGPFDAARLRASLAAIKALIPLDPMAFMPELVEILAACGVVLVMTPELPGTHLSGAARWLTPDKALIQLSLRHGSDDQFWFALFHELDHLLRSGPRSAFLDSARTELVRTPDEATADRFADTQLIPEADFDRIRQGGRFDASDIKRWAVELSAPPGIVVGRLQRAGLVPPSKLNYRKRHWKWGDLY